MFFSQSSLTHQQKWKGRTNDLGQVFAHTLQNVNKQGSHRLSRKRNLIGKPASFLFSQGQHENKNQFQINLALSFV